MLTVQNFTRSRIYITPAIGFVNLLDISKEDQLTEEPGLNLKSVLSYNDGGSIFAKLRTNLFFNFTRGYHRDDTGDLALKVVGLDNNTGVLKVRRVILSRIF